MPERSGLIGFVVWLFLDHTQQYSVSQGLLLALCLAITPRGGHMGYQVSHTGHLHAKQVPSFFSPALSCFGINKRKLSPAVKEKQHKAAEL